MRTQGRFHCFRVSPTLTDLNYYRSFAAVRRHALNACDRSVNDRQRVIEIVHRGANVARRKVKFIFSRAVTR